MLYKLIDGFKWRICTVIEKQANRLTAITQALTQSIQRLQQDISGGLVPVKRTGIPTRTLLSEKISHSDSDQESK